jgi:hypothetical protein
MNAKKEKEISNIIQYFNRQVSNIFKMIDNTKYSTNDSPEVDHIRRITKIARNENPPLMLEKSIDTFWDNKDAIIRKDYVFFTESDVCIKTVGSDASKEWVEKMLDFVRSKYAELTGEDRESIWKYINNMLQAVIKYRIIRGDFQ